MLIAITKVSPADLKELQSLSRQTFFDAFSAQNTEENMRQFLDTEFAEEKLKREIENPESEFYFAKKHGAFIGYLKINFGKAQTELQKGGGMEIERIYVQKEFYGKHVGAMLLHKALAIAKERSTECVWLGVWEKNPRAIRFYEKNGFVQFGSHPFKVGEDVQTDILMKKPLK